MGLWAMYHKYSIGFKVNKKIKIKLNKEHSSFLFNQIIETKSIKL